MKIQILSVSVTTHPTQKGSYQMADVAYKNLTFQGKVEGKKIASFGVTKDSFTTLATAQPNDVYEVNVVKNDKGYNDWVSLAKGSADASNTVSTPAASTGYATAASAPRTSTYETPEERAKKQVYIIRQSSISSAIAALSCGTKSAPKVGEVLEYARHLEAHVFDLNVSFPDVPEFEFPAEAE